ncbi:MAG: MBL fold metallo-hydrolase [Phycisphaerales bacterium]|nr:MBL fold metallo-hydrolase [Phycisphaerales bacterium]
MHRIISIGALDAHPLRNEAAPVRTGHATTTLISTDDGAHILVDPGLPAVALTARLDERAGIAPADITHVFLTSFHPDCRRSLEAFDGAEWMIHAPEREQVGVPMVATVQRAREHGDTELAQEIEREVMLLQKCKPAPDKLARRVDLFPLPGVSPGMCGLLLSERRHTLLICGDAIPTIEHLERGQVLKRAADGALAKDSMQEALEIADLLILGRDELVANPMRGPF